MLISELYERSRLNVQEKEQDFGKELDRNLHEG